MEGRSVILPKADGSEAREGESLHSNEMKVVTSLSEDQDTADKMQQEHLDALNEQIDQVQQRLIALTANDSPSKSSDASFKSAQEQTSPTKPSEKALGKRKEEKLPKQPDDPVALPPPGSILQSTTITQTSSRPTTSHGASMTHNSTAPTSQVSSVSSSKRDTRAPTSTRPSSRRATTGPDPSAASSRRSSFLLNPPTASQTTGRARGHRRTNTTWSSPISIPNPRQALRSLQAFSTLQNDIFTGMEAEERTSLPTLSHPTTAAAQDPSSPDSNPQTPAEYSNYVPPANTDWTTSSTRRREYEEIDKARRGIRGLIRRVTPRFLLKNGRVGFHDGEDGEGSDAGTVRRFRMDVEDDDDSVVGGEGDNVVGGEGDSVVGGEGDSVAVGEEEEEEEGAKSAWWKSIGKKMMMKGKGKKEKSSSAEAGN